ncbi:Tubulin-tyrosine ligase family protein [Toxoplasma gondii ME49]|uniref:Tubulin-tyrosine ligase family protein n=1 Tax=Toxoplasma gondii (strain ATCC 50611 / Me49) TaxID=508771 RepID=S8F9G2_TOXGM|nr:Tubulin-tyrosine ligase family protein [Toxoplasma gondii ME49]EPT31437.1 Tubulin-tyrosine ligase family protein [Toxoplasma gondii ME49]|eukprot:XP_002369763.1 Tubulin-tyrosine ligase family protein [Toxoplasma gondii ME49]
MYSSIAALATRQASGSPGALSKVRLQLNTMARRQLVSAATLAAGQDASTGRQKRIYHGLLKTGGRREGSNEHSSPHVRVSDSDCSPTCPTNYKHIYRAGDSEQISCGPHDSPSDGAVNPATLFGSWGRSGDHCLDNGASDVQASEANNDPSRRQSENAPLVSDSVCPAGTSHRSHLPSQRKTTSRNFQPSLRDSSSPQETRAHETEKDVPRLKSKARQSSASHIRLKTKPADHRETPFSQSCTANQEMRRAHTSKGDRETRNKSSRRPERDAERILLSGTEGRIASNCSESQSPTAPEPPFIAQKVVQRLNTEDTSREPKSGLAKAAEPAVKTNRVEVKVFHLNCSSDSAMHKQFEKPPVADGLSESRRKESTRHKTTSIAHVRHRRRLTGLRLKTSLSADHLEVIRDGTDVVDVGNRRGPKHRQCTLTSQVPNRKEEQNNFSSCSTLASERGAEEAPKYKHGIPGAALVRGGGTHSRPSPAYVNKHSIPDTESRRRWWPTLVGSENLVEEESRQRVKAVEPEDAQSAVGGGDTGQRFQQFSVSRSCGNKDKSTEESDEFSNTVLFEEIEQLQQLLGQHTGGVTPSVKSPERQIHCQNTGVHQLPQSGNQTHRVKPLTKKRGGTAGPVSGGRGSACNRSPQSGLEAIELRQEAEPAGGRHDTTRSSSVRMVSNAASSSHAAQEAIPNIDNHVPDTTVSRSVSSYVCHDKAALDGAPAPGQVKSSWHSTEFPGFQGANADRLCGERPKSALIQFVRNVWCRQNSECNSPPGSSVAGRLSTVVLKHDAHLTETASELRGITVSQDDKCTAENPSKTIQRPDTDVRSVPATDVPSCKHVLLTTVRQSWQTELEKTDLERPDTTCVSSSAQTSDSFLQNESHGAPLVVQFSGATRIGSPDCQIQVAQRSTVSLSAPTFSFEKRNKGERLTHCFRGPSVLENEMPTTFRCDYTELTKGSPYTSGISPADWTEGTQESRSGNQAPDAAATLSMESERRTIPLKCRLSHQVKHNETAASSLLNGAVPLFETADKAKETPGCRHSRASWTRFACVRRVGRLKLRRRHRSRVVKKWKENDWEEPGESRDDVILARDRSPRTNAPAGSRYDRLDPSIVALPLPVMPRMDVVEGAPTIAKRGLETFASAIVTERSLAGASARSAGSVFDSRLLGKTVNAPALACRDPNGDRIAVDDFKESPGVDRPTLASSPAGEYLSPCDRHSTASPASEHAVSRSLQASTVTHLSEPEQPLETTGFPTKLSPLFAAVVRDGGNLELRRQTADGNSSWSSLRLRETSSAGRGRQKNLRHSNGVFRLRIRHRRSTPRGPQKCATPHCLLKRSARARRNKGAHRGVTPAGERTEQDLTRTARRPLSASARREKPAFVLPGSRTADRAATRAARRKPSSSSLQRHSVDDAVWGNCHLNSPTNECLETGCPGLRSNAVSSPLGEDKISLPRSQQARGQTSNGLRGLPRHMAERAGQRLAKEKEGKPGTKEAEDKKVGQREGHRRTKAQGPSSECSSFCRGDSKTFPGSPPAFENPVKDVGRDCTVRGQIREGHEGTVAGQRHLRCETNLPPLGSAEQTRGSKLNWDGEEVQRVQEAGAVSLESPDVSSPFCPFDELFGLPDLIPDEWYGDVSKPFTVDAQDKTRVRTQRRNSSRGKMACLAPCSDFEERSHGVAETGGLSPVQQLKAMQVHREQVEQKHLEAVHALHSPRGLRRDPVALRASPSAFPPLMLDVELDSPDFTACHFPEDLLELIGSVEECSPSALRESPSCPFRCRSCRDSSSSVSSPGHLATSEESSSGSSFSTSSSSISVSSQEETASSPSDRTPPSRGVPSTTSPSSGVDSEKRRVSWRKSGNETASDSASEPESAQDEKSDDENRITKPKQPRSQTKRTLDEELISSASSSATDNADVSQGSDSLSDSHLESSSGSSDDKDVDPEQPRAAPDSSLGKLGRSHGSFVDPLTDNSFNATAEMHTQGGQCGVCPRSLRRKANRQQVKIDRGKSGAHRHPAGRRRRSRSQPPWSSLPKRSSRAQHGRREACLKRRLLALENVCMSHEEYMSHFARKMRLPGVENKVACIELTKAKRALMPQLCFVEQGPEFPSKENSGEDSGSEKGKNARLAEPPWKGDEEGKGIRSRHRAVLTIESAVFSCLQKKGWIMNKLLDTHFFDLKWKISDVDEDYRCLRREQLFNHFQNNRVMTTKAGLSRSFRLLAVEEQVRTDAFFPRCYDLSTLDDCMDFLVDYSRCEAVTVLLNYLRCCQAPPAEFEAIMRQPAPDLSVRQSSVLLLWMAYHLVASWLHELDPDYFLDRHDPLGDRRGLDPQRLEVFATHAWNAREQPVAFRRAWHSLAKCSDGCKETGDHSLGESRVRQFLPGNCQIIPGNDAFDNPSSDCSIGPSEAQILSILLELQNCWPLWRAERGDVDLRNLHASDKVAKAAGSAPRDAMQEPRWNHHNIWIMKPSSSSRASGVYCLNNPWDILKSGRGLSDRLVQKYIERPLLIFSGRKFDMRQWVLIRSFAPLKVYAFTDLYLRLCSEPYDLRDLHNRFRHISNWNLNRLNSELHELRSLGQQGDPPDEGVTSRVFSDCSKPLSALREALDRDTGTENFWDLKIKPQIRKLILQTARAARPSIVPRSNCFELYGFDILLDAEYRPWLIEVNLSPACTARAHWHKQMVTSMTRQLLQILIDEPRGSPLNAQSCVSTRKKPHWELLFDESVPPNNAVRTFPPIEPVSSGGSAQAETLSQAGNPFLQFYSQHSTAAWTPGGQGSSRQKTSREIRSGSSYFIDRLAGHRGITKERRGLGVALGGKADLWNKFMVTGERIERQELLELDTRVRINEAVRRLVGWWRQTAWRRRAAQRRKVKVLEDIELDVFFGN